MTNRSSAGLDRASEVLLCEIAKRMTEGPAARVSKERRCVDYKWVNHTQSAQIVLQSMADQNRMCIDVMRQQAPNRCQGEWHFALRR